MCFEADVCILEPAADPETCMGQDIVKHASSYGFPASVRFSSPDQWK